MKTVNLILTDVRHVIKKDAWSWSLPFFHSFSFPFPLRKPQLPFQTVDASTGNQAFGLDRCNIIIPWIRLP